MHVSRLFTLSFAPLSFTTLIVTAGLLGACQPQNSGNLSTDGTPTVATNKAVSDPIPATAPDNSTADLIVTETVTETEDTADNISADTASPAMETGITEDDNATIVASAPLQTSETQSSETPTPEVQTQDIVPEIVIAGPASPPPPPPPAEFKPDTVLSKPDTVLLSLLGAADIIRTEGQVKIWQYRLDRCVFDFFLTPKNDINSNDMKQNSVYTVRDWAYRATILGTRANELICRRALAKDRMKPAS